MCEVKRQMETIRSLHQENCQAAQINELIVFHSTLAGECVKRLKAHMDRCSVCKAENEQLWGQA